MKISIIVPVLNEASHINDTLSQLQGYREQGHEIIVVDGGSRDNTVSCAEGLSDHVVQSESGRAVQMNTGAKYADADVLLFLHADTRLPDGACDLIVSASGSSHLWGRFDVRLSGNHWMFRIIEFLMNWRSRLTSIATGDQAIFVSSRLFRETGSYPEMRLMEDIALCKKLRRLSKPVCIKNHVVTSSRKWESNGIVQTVLLMWWLRFMFFLGVSPNRLARYYYGKDYYR